MTDDRRYFLDFIRTFACLLVVFSHLQENLVSIVGGEHANLGYIALHGHVAVIIFFVLSGFIVGYITDNKCLSVNYDFKSYLIDRLSRIYSVLIAAVIFTLVLDLIGSCIFQEYSNYDLFPQQHKFLRFFINLFGMQGIFGYRIQFGSNPSLWSIGYEIIFYVLFGLFYFRFERKKNHYIISITILLTIIYLYKIDIFIYGIIWVYGFLIYKISKKIKYSCNFLILILILYGANHYINIENIFKFSDSIRDLISAFIFGIIILISPMYGKILEKPSLISKLSFSLYATHYPVLFFMSCFFVYNNMKTNKILIALMLLGCILIGLIFYLTIERKRFELRIFLKKYI